MGHGHEGSEHPKHQAGSRNLAAASWAVWFPLFGKIAGWGPFPYTFKAQLHSLLSHGSAIAAFKTRVSKHTVQCPEVE